MSRGARLVLPVAVAAVLIAAHAALGVVRTPAGSGAPVVTARSFTVEEDQTFDDFVADFTFQPPSTFTVSITWGDGSSSAGTYEFVSTDPQTRISHYRARGSHRYTTAGRYTTTI